MKKKILITMATLFFAAIAFYNVQVSQHNGDISLEHVALMAQANEEHPPNITCGRYEGRCWFKAIPTDPCIWKGTMNFYCVEL